MKIYEVQDRTPQLVSALVDIWENSVRATHHFLTDQESKKIKEYVPQALNAVEYLILTEDDEGKKNGFMGVEQGRLEMLFLSPEVRGRGIGKQLLRYGIKNYGIQELTVNEQNPQAVGFYRHLGFVEYKRTELDEEGNPYPLFYMKLENS